MKNACVYLACVPLFIFCIQNLGAQEVRVSGLQPVNFQVWDSSTGGNGYVTVENFGICTWKENIGNDRYWITADDGILDGTFAMDDGLGNKVPVDVRWQRIGVGGWTNLTENSASRFSSADRDASVNDCSNTGPSAKLQVRYQQNWPAGKPQGVYTLLLNVLMMPD